MNLILLARHYDIIDIIGTTIIGGLMLYGFIKMINEDRVKDGKNPMGCLVTIIVIILVILFWSIFP